MELVGSLVKDALPELFTEGQVVAAEQQFHRRLAEYEMNIEQQKLFREDLRDLVELTVGRMDIYHLVGALLLEFCIHFYCENEMLQSTELPFWISTIFLLSNLAATGYLVFAVWLSMHASVASHSIGVRLLTRFARLSIPSRKELENVARAPLVPIMERFAQLGQRFGVSLPGRAAGQASAASSTAAASESTSWQRPSAPRSRVSTEQTPRVSFALPAGTRNATSFRLGGRADSWTSAYDGNPQSSAIEEGEKALADRQRHFRRFLREQRRWLCYDAYARVCMSLGMNQMLAALSYYIVGKVAVKAPGAAMVSLLGFQAISFLLLRLDVTQGFHKKREALAILFFVPFPPIYIGALAWTARANPNFHKVALQYLFLPGYLLHGGWLFVIAMVLSPATNDVLDIPRRLRTVLYLDVLHLEQEEVANAVMSQEARSFADELRVVANELEEMMVSIVTEEREAASVSGARRKGPELVALKDQLQDLVDDVRTRNFEQPTDAMKEARRAEWVLERCAVWQQAPEVQASLEALQNFQVQSFLSEGEKELILRAQADFLQMCQDLDLGIVMPDNDTEQQSEADADTSNPVVGASRTSATSGRGTMTLNVQEARDRERTRGSSELRHFEVDPSERPAVRVEYDSGYTFETQSVWIRPADEALSDVQHSAPEGATTDVGGTLEGTLPEWRSRGEKLLTTPRTPAQSLQPVPVDSGAAGGSPTRSASAGSMGRALLRRSSTMASTWEASEQPLLPTSATPPEQLPKVIVRRFTLVMSLLWFLSAAVHLVTLLTTNASEPAEEGQLEAFRFSVHWPEPASLFQVSSLHCNDSLVVVDSGFSIYAAWGVSDRVLPPLTRLEESGAGLQALLCDKSQCAQMTTFPGPGLQIKSFPGSARRLQENSTLEISPSWRLVTAAAAPCQQSSCEDLVLAAWDGAQIVIASASRRSPGSGWQLQSRFAVRRHHVRQQSSSPHRQGEVYRDVQALHLGPGGRSLAVLHSSGLLDGWNLVDGVRVGQWRLGTGALALCRTGNEFLVAREDDDAGPPILEAVPVPAALSEADCQRSLPTGTAEEGWSVPVARVIL